MTSRDVQFGPCVAGGTSLLVWLLAPAELFPDLGAVSPCTTRLVPLVEARLPGSWRNTEAVNSDSLKVLITAKGWVSRSRGTLASRARYWYAVSSRGLSIPIALRFSAAPLTRRNFGNSSADVTPLAGKPVNLRLVIMTQFAFAFSVNALPILPADPIGLRTFVLRPQRRIRISRGRIMGPRGQRGMARPHSETSASVIVRLGYCRIHHWLGRGRVPYWRRHCGMSDGCSLRWRMRSAVVDKPVAVARHAAGCSSSRLIMSAAQCQRESADSPITQVLAIRWVTRWGFPP